MALGVHRIYVELQMFSLMTLDSHITVLNFDTHIYKGRGRIVVSTWVKSVHL